MQLFAKYFEFSVVEVVFNEVTGYRPTISLKITSFKNIPLDFSVSRNLLRRRYKSSPFFRPGEPGEHVSRCDIYHDCFLFM